MTPLYHLLAGVAFIVLGFFWLLTADDWPGRLTGIGFLCLSRFFWLTWRTWGREP